MSDEAAATKGGTEGSADGGADRAAQGSKAPMSAPSRPLYVLAIPPPDCPAPVPQEKAKEEEEATLVVDEGGVRWKQCKSGFLMKQGKRFKTWKRRFFLLSSKSPKESVLRYFTDSNSTSFAMQRFGGKNGIEKGSLTLSSGCVIIDKVNNKCKGYGFDVLTKDRHYRFAAETARDRHEWIKELSNTVFSQEKNDASVLMPEESILQELFATFSATGAEFPLFAPTAASASETTPPPRDRRSRASTMPRAESPKEKTPDKLHSPRKGSKEKKGLESHDMESDSDCARACVWVTSYRVLVQYNRRPHEEVEGEEEEEKVRYLSIPIDSIAEVRIELSERHISKLHAGLDRNSVRENADLLLDMWVNAKDAAMAGYAALAAYNKYTVVLMCKDFRVVRLGFEKARQSRTEQSVKTLLLLLNSKMLLPAHDLPKECLGDHEEEVAQHSRELATSKGGSSIDARRKACFFDAKAEAERLGVSGQWTLLRAAWKSPAKQHRPSVHLHHEPHESSSTVYLVHQVPFSATIKLLQRACKIREGGRVPSLVWRDSKSRGHLFLSYNYTESFLTSREKVTKSRASVMSRTPPLSQKSGRRRTLSMSESDVRLDAPKKQRAGQFLHLPDLDNREAKEREKEMFAESFTANRALMQLIANEAKEGILRILRVVPGKAQEAPVKYPRCTSTALELPPLSCLHAAYQRLYILCSGPESAPEVSPQEILEAIDETQWMDATRALLRLSIKTAQELKMGKCWCVECPEDSRFFGKALCSLVMVLLDPHYRTPVGFCVLLNQFWSECWTGTAEPSKPQPCEGFPANQNPAFHSPLRPENGGPHSATASLGSFTPPQGIHNGSPVGTTEPAPGAASTGADARQTPAIEDSVLVLTQFFDCVWQLMQYYPRSFQFNANFLTSIIQGVTCGTLSFRATMASVGTIDQENGTQRPAKVGEHCDIGPPARGGRKFLFPKSFSSSSGKDGDNFWALVSRHHREFLNPLYKSGASAIVDVFDMKDPSFSCFRKACWLPYYLRHSHMRSTDVGNRLLRRATGEWVDLSLLGLLTIPSVIGSMAHLQEVNLSYNFLMSIPIELSLLPNLRELDLSGNFIHAPFNDNLLLPPSLKVLGLQENRLTVISPKIASLQNLEELYLKGNSISSLPECLTALSQLKTLDVSFNPLRELPSFLCDLAGLEELSLEGIGLRSMPEDLHHLGRLRYLNLATNPELESAQWSMRCRSSLSEMTLLDLSGNPHFDSSFYFSMTNLTGLHLRELGLHQLPGNVGNLVALEALDLQDNDFTEFPQVIFRLSCLKRLNLRANQLEQLPLDVAQLVSLTSLNVSANQLAPLDLYGVGMLPLLARLDVSENEKIEEYCRTGDVPLANIGRLSHTLTHLKIFSEGWISGPELHGLLHRQEELLGAEVTYQHLPRLMFVGPSNGGKSSLIKWLTSRFEADKKGRTASNKTLQFDFMAPTQGVAIKNQFVVLPERRDNKKMAVKTLMSTWDFGGHPQFRSSHQLFMAADAVYVVLFNITNVRDELPDVELWLRIIHSKAPGAQVVLVGTHVDTLSAAGYASALQYAEQLKSGLRKACPSIGSIFLVSCAPKTLRKACRTTTAITTAKKAAKKIQEQSATAMTRQLMGLSALTAQLFELEEHLLSLVKTVHVSYTFTDLIYLLKRARSDRQPPIVSVFLLSLLSVSLSHTSFPPLFISHTATPDELGRAGGDGEGV